MAVLVEAISVVIRADRLIERYPGGWRAFVRGVPNATMCADGEVVRVGFMSPDDVKAYVDELAAVGMVYLDGGKAVDLVVIDQLRGPAVPCDWIEFGHISLDGDESRKVAACRLVDSAVAECVMPDGWTFAESLSRTHSFIRTEHVDKATEKIREDDDLDVYRNRLTGGEMFVGRPLKRDR